MAKRKYVYHRPPRLEANDIVVISSPRPSLEEFQGGVNNPNRESPYLELRNRNSREYCMVNGPECPRLTEADVEAARERAYDNLQS